MNALSWIYVGFVVGVIVVPLAVMTVIILVDAFRPRVRRQKKLGIVIQFPARGSDTAA